MFLHQNKKLWLLPIVVVMLLLGRSYSSLPRDRRSRLSSTRSSNSLQQNSDFGVVPLQYCTTGFVFRAGFGRRVRS